MRELFIWLECPHCHQLTQTARVRREAEEVVVCLLDGAECGHTPTEQEDDVLEQAAYRMFLDAEADEEAEVPA